MTERSSFETKRTSKNREEFFRGSGVLQTGRKSSGGGKSLNLEEFFIGGEEFFTDGDEFSRRRGILLTESCSQTEESLFQTERSSSNREKFVGGKGVLLAERSSPDEEKFFRGRGVLQTECSSSNEGSSS